MGQLQASMIVAFMDQSAGAALGASAATAPVAANGTNARPRNRMNGRSVRNMERLLDGGGIPDADAGCEDGGRERDHPTGNRGPRSTDGDEPAGLGGNARLGREDAFEVERVAGRHAQGLGGRTAGAGALAAETAHRLDRLGSRVLLAGEALDEAPAAHLAAKLHAPV